jgi:hypothetical protein
VPFSSLIYAIVHHRAAMSWKPNIAFYHCRESDHQAFVGVVVVVATSSAPSAVKEKCLDVCS